MPQRIAAVTASSVQVVPVALIVLAKFAVPVLIIGFPFAAGWANFFLDGFDGDLLIPLGLPNDIYQPVDKVTDWVTYVAIVICAYRRAWPIRQLMLGLFLFRSIGQVSFLLTENELFLAFFPNFLEPLFLVTASILAWERAVRHYPDWQERSFAFLSRHRWIIGTLIVVYKLQDEFLTHIANFDRSEWFQKLLGGS